MQTRCLRPVAPRRLTSRFSVSHLQALALSSHVQLPVFSLGDSIASGHHSKGADVNLFQRKYNFTAGQPNTIVSLFHWSSPRSNSFTPWPVLFFLLFSSLTILPSKLQNENQPTNETGKKHTHCIQVSVQDPYWFRNPKMKETTRKQGKFAKTQVKRSKKKS